MPGALHNGWRFMTCGHERERDTGGRDPLRIPPLTGHVGYAARSAWGRRFARSQNLWRCTSSRLSEDQNASATALSQHTRCGPRTDHAELGD
jgi:hypothetical protein